MVASATLGRVPFIARVQGASARVAERLAEREKQGRAAGLRGSSTDEGPEVGEKGWGNQLIATCIHTCSHTYYTYLHTSAHTQQEV